MLHNLEWLHDLDVLYDASTFDTDPFEPQPDGVGTIFPFWVPRPETKFQDPESQAHSVRQAGSSREGYVELPYTLVQDSTLFLSLREKSPAIWLRKLDWIAEHGGMALLNVHPDYLRFPGEPPSPRTFPVELYSQFLTYLKHRYSGSYWQPLPHELASWFAQNRVAAKPASPSSSPVSISAGRPFQGKHAAVLLFSYYEHDPRVRRSTEALSRAGMEVEVICLRQEGETSHGQINGVNVTRVPLKRRRAGKVVYALQYSLFWLAAFCMLSARSLRRRYEVIHVHNMPDFLVFSTLVPKWLGAKVILDLHDPMPELMMTIFGLKEKSFAVRFLKWMEKASVSFADLVLTVNRPCQEIFTSRSSAPGKIHVLMNTPDERIFKFRPEPLVVKHANTKPFVVLFHGSIVERNGLDLAVAAIQMCRETVPGVELRICGAATPFLDTVLDSARKAGLNGSVRYLGQKLQEDIVKEIEQCDVGVIPNRENAFTEINTPVRIFEYLSLGKPVITPRSRGITDYFMAADLIYFEVGNAPDLARRLEFVYQHPEEVQAILRRGQSVYRDHCWSSERERFLAWVGELLAPRRPV
jgi:glycosyltransferase involved in cell wall biosynthesis